MSFYADVGTRGDGKGQLDRLGVPWEALADFLGGFSGAHGATDRVAGTEEVVDNVGG